MEGPRSEDFPRIAELVEQYAGFPLGGTDASVIALAERLDTATIITLDHRHFAAVTPRHTKAFELLPRKGASVLLAADALGAKNLPSRRPGSTLAGIDPLLCTVTSLSEAR